MIIKIVFHLVIGFVLGASAAVAEMRGYLPSGIGLVSAIIIAAVLFGVFFPLHKAGE